jgi:cytochrome-b5 reductase
VETTVAVAVAVVAVAAGAGFLLLRSKKPKGTPALASFKQTDITRACSSSVRRVSSFVHTDPLVRGFCGSRMLCLLLVGSI